uniref:Uncharacterized protein n=1 Tax=Tetranychus urticae TaxID=32264 RepID=T1K618_TETUR
MHLNLLQVTVLHLSTGTRKHNTKSTQIKPDWTVQINCKYRAELFLLTVNQ